jgi:hypothetical protein
MTYQTLSLKRLGGSPAGIFRPCALTLAAFLAIGGAAAATAQDQPAPAKPAQPAKKATEKKPAASADKVVGGYLVHQSLEMGGRITANQTGSQAMWATMVNQSTGMRIMGQSLEMHSVNPSKTPFFDTLSTSSAGYGGDPYDMSYFRMSKGRFYDFAGSFRRDRNYFDYNLLANSLLGPTALVPEPSTPHLFNTVRRNTDTVLTLMPLARINYRVGYNHGTHEGPSYSTVHMGGDVQVLQGFRNASDTYTGGVDVKLSKRTILSYDQFYVLYKGDSPYSLVGANYQLTDGTPVSLGINTLSTAKCGGVIEVVGTIANPKCSSSSVQSQAAPTRTSFPTEQLRFVSHYWDRLSMNGRVTYNSGITNVNSFNETFTGFLSRTYQRQEIDSGALGNGRLAHNKRVSVNADYSIEGELNKIVSISDVITFQNFRLPSSNSLTVENWAGSAAAGTTALTPLSSLTPTTTTTSDAGFLGQRNLGNTVLATFTVMPEFKLSGGWRFNTRRIAKDEDDPLNWHQNWLLLGAVIQPSHVFRLNVNLEEMEAKNSDSATTTNTYTREAPDKIFHLRGRATYAPNKWFNLAVAGNDYSAKNSDPLVNHQEHSRNISVAAHVAPIEAVGVDFNMAHDDTFSVTDLCYVYTATASAPLPPGASNSGTCTVTNSPDTGSASYYLGNGYYHAPVAFYSGSISYAPARIVKFVGGVRLNSVSGGADEINPNMVPGALNSTTVSPFTDLQVTVAPQWTWHGNWEHHGYGEAGAAGPASRDYHGDIVSLSVKYAF